MPREYTALFPFCGLGAGALGFLQAQHEGASFRSLGGIDFDPIACADFEHLTGSPSWCADLLKVTPQQLRDRYGERGPDVVFMSPPCKGASGLLSKGAADSDKYRQMNELAYVWTVLMMAAWPIHRPRLVLLENVPRLPSRAPAMLGRVKELLKEAGYELSEGFHDCGVLGGLAQHRRRFLLVARLRQKTEHLLYEPPAKRVLGCGEVLSQLPIPLPDQETSAGPMHRLPRLSWLNWVRLALIPAGGDWRDLPGVLEEGQRRGEVWKRHRVESWGEPVGTVAGSGSNGVANVADPRPGLPGLSSNPARHHNKYEVRDWSKPTGTVIGATRPGSGAPAVADPRIALGYETRDGTNHVTGWQDPVPTVTSQSGRAGHCSGGHVADPRVKTAYDHGYAVLDWKQPSFTIATKTSPGCGAYAVADPRDLALGCAPRAGAYGVMSWEEAAATVTGSACHDNGCFSVADPRKPPPTPVVIIAQDGTWHRPLTTLELALLQGLPATVDGKPLVLGGTISQAREHIGNAVPVGTARAIAVQMLRTLNASDEGTMFLDSSAVWVAPERRLPFHVEVPAIG